MNISEYKEISEIIRNLISTFGIVIGGIWGYFKFIKGRIYTPKIEINLNDKIFRVDDSNNLLLSEIIVKNVGDSIINPTFINVRVDGIISNEMGTITRNILPERDILPFKVNSKNLIGEYYIDPNEFSSRIVDCKIYDEFLLILVTITVKYNKLRQTQRIFSIENKK